MITLVGVVAGMAVVALARSEIRVGECQVSPGGNLATQLRLFRMHMGRYPAKLSELCDQPAEPDQARRWRGPYITHPGSLLDAWGNALRYRTPGAHNVGGYDVWSPGADGLTGTADDFCNWARPVFDKGWHAAWAGVVVGGLMTLAGIRVLLLFHRRKHENLHETL